MNNLFDNPNHDEYFGIMYRQFEHITIYNAVSYRLLSAGFPAFPANFSRDSFMSLALFEDIELLKNQIEFSSQIQGSKSNQNNGEEIGKIHHEYPGVELRGKNTQYNACDTTALYLLAHEQYLKSTGDRSLIEKYDLNIKIAIDYILSHLSTDGMFMEDCSGSNSKCFALYVTYWKDSSLLGRKNDEHYYPAFYFLAHCMNLAGLRAAKNILGTDQLDSFIDRMVGVIHNLFNKYQKFPVAIDSAGEVFSENSDFLHALYYLEKDDLTETELNWIINQSKILETEYGFMLNNPDFCSVDEPYHSCTLWPFEQAFIHLGAEKFNLKQISDMATRVYDKFENFPEILLLKDNKLEVGGNNLQLWTFSCMEYFKSVLLV